MRPAGTAAARRTASALSLTSMLDLALIGLAVVALAVGLLPGRRQTTALARNP
jgi:hypothetical protein